MNQEQTNRALAAWLGWKRDLVYWTYKYTFTGYTDDPNESLPGRTYFNPYQRIDHAWLLVEHMATQENDQFAQWWDHEGIYGYSASEAARAICEAVLEIAEIAV